ncbi:hypothetical protein HRI_001345500 [Hibiscus trionum]|uniref:Uncharacterized protein n=1 Tax=Hibiscus trionum TaxID=183268 RepID=A0A9W7HG03_HIBTR|nr:hypothetical protein HRI_001345500 [Hibiscus trionum]
MAGDSTTDSPSPSPSPNKRLKTLSKSIVQDESSDNHPPEQQQSADEDDSDPEMCGICLSNGGRRAIRGKINSCDHFFCFVCIMEWAKVESRCPMCKRRFTAIHRPPKEGVFASERLVNIPQRDQVYHLSGNAASGPCDPYAEVKCSVCHGVTDESLLLLCDLCDSAAHTYCVGLGATVPDGDWFCHDCALSRSEHNKTEVDTETDDQMFSANYNVKLPTETDVSIFDIVRESNTPGLNGHNVSVSSCANYLPPGIIPGWESNGADEASRPSRNTVGNSTESVARTLRVCRNVHSRIQVLRENWRSLQNRSLSFSSGVAESSGGSRGKGKVTAVFHHGSNESQSSTSTSQQSTSRDNSILPKEDLYDIDKAWKMMNIAKSMQKNCKTTSSPNQNSTKLPCLRSTSKEAVSSMGLHISKMQQIETRNEERTGEQKQYGYHYHEREREKHKSPDIEKQKRIVLNIGPSDIVRSSRSPQSLQPSSSAKVQIQNGCCRVNDTVPFVKNTKSRCQESSSATNTEDRSGSSSLVSSVLRGSTNSLDSNLEASVNKLDIPEGRTGLDRSCSKSKDKKDDNVKSEIQALVKLNLKLLSQDNKLGVDVFKEIARLATHTILAACGFQHSKSRVHSFPIPNVVCSIMVEKGQARSS